MNAFQKMFMQADGSLDEAVCGAALGTLSLIALDGYAVYRGQPFDAQAFGIGIGAIWGGTAALMKLRKESTPGNP